MRFVCLHGIGTNNEVSGKLGGLIDDGCSPSATLITVTQIFKSQTAALRYVLGSEHEFVFAQGTVSWAMAKELEGVNNGLDEYYAYFDPADARSYLAAYHQFDKFIKTEGPFDGV